MTDIEKENVNEEEKMESAEKDPENRNDVEMLDDQQDEIEEKEAQGDGEENSKENENDEADTENIEFI